jgi:hypothetical protein
MTAKMRKTISDWSCICTVKASPKIFTHKEVMNLTRDLCRASTESREASSSGLHFTSRRDSWKRNRSVAFQSVGFGGSCDPVLTLCPLRRELIALLAEGFDPHPY